MAEVRGFLEYQRSDPPKEAPELRIKHSREFVLPAVGSEMRRQAARCMECGVPFCHAACPLGNVIPIFNDHLSREDWKAALDVLLQTNPFPEFTGRICPAPCENACVLGINDDPVAIESIERSLADRGFAEGWIQARPPGTRTGHSVAVVGSGPAGLAAAWELNRAGHSVTVFEQQEEPGGLLMFGIPDFKLEKDRVRRRVQLLESEGVRFKTGVTIGVTMTMAELSTRFAAIVLALGATRPRDLVVPGRDLGGVAWAFDFLKGHTLRLMGRSARDAPNAKGKRVIVIGGGDAGADCVGITHRQGALSVTQFEVLAQPTDVGIHPRRWERPAATPWPEWPLILRTSTSHEEGGKRQWAVATQSFTADDRGNVAALRTVSMGRDPSGNWQAVAGTEQEWPCDMVLIAVGYEGPERPGTLANELRLAETGLVAHARGYSTEQPGVFVCGDMRRGQSLVVWAMREGLETARAVTGYLAVARPPTHAKNVNILNS